MENDEVSQQISRLERAVKEARRLALLQHQIVASILAGPRRGGDDE
jgi:hypothetical protein